MDLHTGKLLIAIPSLPDANFFRSVVFMIEHSDDGAIGVVLNRPANVRVDQLWEKLAPELDVERKESVYLGGPVQGPVLALHDNYAFSERSVIDGVYMTMSGEKLNQLVMEPNGKLKAFTGYSGWAPGQLEAEIERGGWLLASAEPKHVFGDCNELWKDVCAEVGDEIMLPIAVKNRVSGDPNLN
jgi:putative transcriptional regulator